MDSKITKKRLSAMLSYDWVKIILTAVGIILLWSFLFSATSTKITNTQLFTVHSYTGNTTLTSTNFGKTLDKAFGNDKVFSYEVIETGYYDYSTTGSETNTLLTTRLSVGEGDVIFLSPAKNPSSGVKLEGSDELVYTTYSQQFIDDYFYFIYNFDKDEEGNFTRTSYFGEMELYLEEFFGENWETGELNEEKVESTFRARIKKKKDKRFKTKAQIEQGIRWEIERLEKYRSALLETYAYFDAGLLKTETYTIIDSVTEETATHSYALNICPDEDKAKNLKNIIVMKMITLAAVKYSI